MVNCPGFGRCFFAARALTDEEVERVGLAFCNARSAPQNPHNPAVMRVHHVLLLGPTASGKTMFAKNSMAEWCAQNGMLLGGCCVEGFAAGMGGRSFDDAVGKALGGPPDASTVVFHARGPEEVPAGGCWDLVFVFTNSYVEGFAAADGHYLASVEDFLGVNRGVVATASEGTCCSSGSWSAARVQDGVIAFVSLYGG
jgi:hypothetical protein